MAGGVKVLEGEILTDKKSLLVMLYDTFYTVLTSRADKAKKIEKLKDMLSTIDQLVKNGVVDETEVDFIRSLAKTNLEFNERWLKSERKNKWLIRSAWLLFLASISPELYKLSVYLYSYIFP